MIHRDNRVDQSRVEYNKGDVYLRDMKNTKRARFLRGERHTDE